MSLRGCVTAVILLCMALLGPGQARMALAGTEQADLALYAMPDGTLPTICAAHGTPDKPLHAGDHCLACFLAAPFTAPDAFAAPPRNPRRPDRIVIADGPVATGRHWHHSPARGPPDTDDRIASHR